MKLGNFETNNVYNVDCYKAIKELPDKSIDCIYVDIPYLYNQGGSVNSELGERTAKKRLALMGAGEKYLKWFKIAQDRLDKIDANGQISLFLN